MTGQTAALGAGGMGEVRRATDTTLGRDVAIKVLPPEVTQDAERLGRFRREAQILASLNYSNLAAIHGLEEAEGNPFLKDRLQKGAIPVEEALEIAGQIAGALLAKAWAGETHGRGLPVGRPLPVPHPRPHRDGGRGDPL